MKINETTSPGTLIQNVKTGKVYKMWSSVYRCAAGYEVVCYKALGPDGKMKGPIITSRIENMAMVTRPA
jgi:hypothetical protein